MPPPPPAPFFPPLLLSLIPETLPALLQISYIRPFHGNAWRLVGNQSVWTRQSLRADQRKARGQQPRDALRSQGADARHVVHCFCFLLVFFLYQAFSGYKVGRKGKSKRCETNARRCLLAFTWVCFGPRGVCPFLIGYFAVSVCFVAMLYPHHFPRPMRDALSLVLFVLLFFLLPSLFFVFAPRPHSPAFFLTTSVAFFVVAVYRLPPRWSTDGCRCVLNFSETLSSLRLPCCPWLPQATASSSRGSRGSPSQTLSGTIAMRPMCFVPRLCVCVF